jgi:hypothetical protein
MNDLVESAEGWNYVFIGGKGWVEAEWAGNMQEAIERVRTLHAKVTSGTKHGKGWTLKEGLCVPCESFYPCPTIKALDGKE